MKEKEEFEKGRLSLDENQKTLNEVEKEINRNDIEFLTKLFKR
ncbi:hypothetical protein [Winogradskyella poriferorum]